MSMLQPYNFLVLQYIHDLGAGEVINVGVALHAPKSNYVSAMCRQTYARLSAIYPGFDGEYFKSNMRHINSSFSKFNDSLNFKGYSSLAEYAYSILPKDDGSLQWSSISSGVTKNPEKELMKLFERYVTHHDSKHQRERRTENDIWKNFKKELDSKKISSHFVQKKISVHDDEINFSHAWKNGIWHCIEPLSFDLSSPEYIKEKAHKWLGQISSVSQGKEEFKLYLVVAKPSEVALHGAYEKAVSILNKIPANKEIIPEDESLQLIERLAVQIEDHVH